jgi:DNA-binding LacI/PurR family transcriptional regulator
MPPTKTRRPTMAQVAGAAGVSVMTVSYTYSQPDRVSPEAAAKVRAAAAKLGYPGPHPGARSLRRGRAGSLGVVLSERLTYAFDDPQATRFLSGVAAVCAAEGLGLTLVPTTGQDSDAARVAEAAVDGFVLWTTSEEDPVLAAVVATGLPAVIHAGPARPGLAVVGIDDRAAAAAIGAAAFAGSRRPAVLSFPLDRDREQLLLRGPLPAGVRYPVTRDRWHGLADAWTGLGGALGDLRTAVCPHNSAALGEALTRALLAGENPPDAIAAMSDELALGALRAADRAGLAVPVTLAVTGWDDSDAAAAAGLTTLAQSLRGQGIRCAQLALGLGAPSPRPDRADWRVVHRRSTRTVPSSDPERALDEPHQAHRAHARGDRPGRPHRGQG